METIERQAGGFGGHQAGTAAVAEQQEAQHLLEFPLLLKMQAGEFQVDHQHLRLWFGAHDVAGELQCVHRGEATHEADDCAFDGRRKAGRLHDVEIEAGGGEAGAACHDQVGYGGAIAFDVQCGDRLFRECQRLAFEAGHAVGGGGEVAAPVETLAVEEVIARLRSRFEEGEPVLDVGQAHHAIEQRGGARVRQSGAGEVDELRVDVVRGYRGADPVEPGLGHLGPFLLCPVVKDAIQNRFIPSMWDCEPDVL